MGTGVIVLPRRVAQFAGQDGWIIVVGLIILAMLVGFLISAAVSAATKTKPNAGFIEFTGYLLTRPVAYLCGIVLWLKLVFAAGLELRVFMEITQSVMLPQTPLPAVSIAVILVCGYAAAKGIETRARVAEVLFAVMALPFIFLVGLAFFDTNFSNLQPVLVTPPSNLLEGTLRLGFIFTGLECLLLVSPFIRKGKHMGRHVAGALGFAGGIILLITVLTIAKFGPGVASQPWPVLRMMDMLNIPGSFIERQEVLMFTFWIITAFAIGNAMLFFGGVLVKDMFKPKAKHLGVIVTMGAAFAVSVFPWGDIYRVLDVMYMTVGVFFLVVLPVILLVVAKFKKMVHAKSESSHIPMLHGSGFEHISTSTAQPLPAIDDSDEWKTMNRNQIKRPVRTISLVLILLALTFLLTSCWDRVELEDRAFVVAIGIDKSDNDEFEVSITVPLLKKGEDDESGEEGNIKTASASTITEAMKKLDAKTDKTLYYGQAKLLVLGQDLFSDAEMTSRAIGALKNKAEIDLRINVLAANGDAKDILEAKPPGETLPGLFVAEIYRNKSKLGGESFALDLERLSVSFCDGAIVPMIKHDEDEGAPLKLHGAAVIKNRHKIDSLSPEKLQGFLWCKNHGNNGAVVTLEYDDKLIPVKIDKHTAKISFDKQNDTLRALVDVKVVAHVEEPPDENVNLKQKLAAQISKEISATADELQNKYALDGYDWLEHLRKKNYDLYKRYSGNWEDVFVGVEVVPKVVVDFEG